MFLDLVGVAGRDNTGGHFAHPGGALLGFLFVRQLREGRDLSVGVNRLLEQLQNIFQRRPKPQEKARPRPKVVYKNTAATSGKQSKGHAAPFEDENSYQEQLDAILDKIKQSGYDSLSAHEKDFLFNASKR